MSILEQFKKEKSTYRIAIDNNTTVGEIEDIIGERLEEALRNKEDLEPYRLKNRVEEDYPDYIYHCVRMGFTVYDVARDILNKSVGHIKRDMERVYPPTKMGRKRKPLNVEEMRRLHKKGLSCREIAKKLGNISYSTISRRLRD